MPVRKRSKGSWEIYLDIGRDPATGKRLRHYEAIRGTKKDAQQRLAELHVEVEKQSYVRQPKQLTVASWLEQWLKDYVEMHCSPRTVESYRSIVHKHLIPALGKLPLTKLEPYHVQVYHTRKLSQGRIAGRGGLSRRSVQYHHVILSEALKNAVRLGLLVRNVCQVVDPPSPERKEMATLTSDEVPDFLEAIEVSPYRTLFYVSLFTGLRRSELLGLQWGDLTLELASLSVARTLHQLDSGEYVIRPPKTKKSKRVVDLSPNVALLLRQHRKEQEAQRALVGKPLREDDWVFAHPDGNPLRPGTVSHAFSKLSHKGVIPKLRLHDLRHSHATLLLEDGMDINAVKQRLGHSSAAFTLDTYGHVTPRMQRAVVDSLDRLVEKNGEKNGGKMVAKGSRLSVGRTGLEPVTP